MPPCLEEEEEHSETALQRRVSWRFERLLVILTCYAEKNATERDPTVSASSFEVQVYVRWRKRFQNARVVLEDVVHSSGSDEEEPNKHYRRKEPSYFVSAVVLHTEQSY